MSSENIENVDNNSDKKQIRKKKEDININIEHIIDGINKRQSNNNIFIEKIKNIPTYNKLKSEICKYDNQIIDYHIPLSVILRSKFSSSNSDIKLKYYSNILNFIDKLLGLNKYIENITNLHSNFENEDEKDSEYFIKDNETNIYFLKSDSIIDYIFDLSKDDFKNLMKDILTTYFKSLNELMVLLYCFDILIKDNIIPNDDKITFKCKKRINEPNVVYLYLKEDSSKNKIQKFGYRKRVKTSKNIEKYKKQLSNIDSDKSINNVTTLLPPIVTIWDEIDNNNDCTSDASYKSEVTNKSSENTDEDSTDDSTEEVKKRKVNKSIKISNHSKINDSVTLDDSD